MGTIAVSNLGKAYKQYPSRWVPLAELLVLFCPKRHTLKWVLQEINLPDQPGAADGINGHRQKHLTKDDHRHHTDNILKNFTSDTEMNYTLDLVVNLGLGKYLVVTALTSSDTHLINNYDWIDRALTFSVTKTNKPTFPGSVWLEHQTKFAKTKCLDTEAAYSNDNRNHHPT